MRVNNRLKTGDLVRVKIYNKSFTEDGFSTISVHPNPMYGTLHEYINIQTYPSSRDFLGRHIAVRHDQEAVIVKFVGKPLSLITASDTTYNIYEILVNGYICHVFEHNLELVCTST